MFCWAVHLTGEPKEDRNAAVTVGDKVYYFGEFYDGNAAQMDVHVFNTVSLCWRKVPLVTTGTGELHLEGPSRHTGHTVVLIEDIVYIWGGWNYPREDYNNVLYAFDLDAHQWFKPRVSGSVPEERDDHSACVLGKVMFIHGGHIMLTGQTNDMYKLDTTTMVWSVIYTRGTLPPASQCHSATIIGTKMFVFGGCGRQDYNTVRVFDTETNCWLNINASAQLHPEERCHHSAFAYNGELYIFGGVGNKDQTFSDLWKFNPENFSWKKVQPKSKGPGSMHAMCCCMVGDRIILFGSNNKPNDLFILDLSPSLKTLCKLVVIQYGLEQAELTHDIRWELAAMTTNRN